LEIAALYILGINAAFHDPAACLVKDGQVLAAAEEERFTHIKHGKRPIPFSAYELPFHAIDYCLQAAGIHLKDVEHIAYSYDPFIQLGQQQNETTIPLSLQLGNPGTDGLDSAWDPLFLSYIVNAPAHLADGVPHHLKARLEGAREKETYRWHFVSHHLAHAASAFHASPFQDAAVMTLDGRGEKTTTSYNVGSGTRLTCVGDVSMPHSLGILYERITSYLGFLHSSDEYKVMALASFGKNHYVDEFRDIVRLDGSGHYTIAPLHLVERFGPARQPGEPFEERHYHLAHSLQAVLEETVLDLSQWLHRETNADRLCLAGGVALNCVMNAKIRDCGPYRQVWVQPAAGDAGTALGAALWVDTQERRSSDRSYCMSHAFLGPAYEDEEIEGFLRRSKLSYERMTNVAEQVADLLAQDLVLGWFQGRMEFGPRALGARSILASPTSANMQDRLNDIKDREDFRPVAPVVLEEEAMHWFVNADVSPFMLFVYDVRPDKANLIPAVRHVDGTARVQTIRREQHPVYYDLLSAFHRRTGVPVLVNTSFNTRGEPIVCSPRDAVESFWTSPLDALVIGSFLLKKDHVVTGIR
jgi:carbamoyltransferase